MHRVPLAATGVALLQLGAIINHVRLRDPLGQSVSVMVLLLPAIFLAGRSFSAYEFQRCVLSLRSLCP